MSLTKATYSMISGAPVNVFDYMTAAQIADVQAGTLAVDVTASINAAINAAKQISGQVYVPSGKYSIAPDSLLITGVDGLSIIGENHGFGTYNNLPQFVCSGAGAYLLRLQSSSGSGVYHVYIENIVFDGKANVTDVISFSPIVGEELTFGQFKFCEFVNVSPAGGLVSNYTASAIFAESALWTFEDCGFACNGGAGNQGVAVKLNNYGAWGWVFNRCHFDTQTYPCHFQMTAGEATLNNCIFDNTAAGSSDIQFYNSAGLTLNNCISGTNPAPFLISYNKSTTGKYDNYPLNINNCAMHSVYAGANAIQLSAPNPVYINGFYGSNVLLNGAPIIANIQNAEYIYQTNKTATQLLVQGPAITQNALALASNDVTTFLQVNVNSSTGVGISSYKPSVGYMPYQISSSTFGLSSGVPSYANNAAAIAGGLAIGTFYRNGDALQIVH